MELSVVIPVYNEEKKIGNTLKKINSYLKKKRFDYEIILVDDGSKDKTIRVVEDLKDRKIRIIRNKKNKGKGYSVKRGMLSAKKKLILFSDADLSTPIQELEKFIPLLKKNDILIGSRNLKESKIKIKQPFLRSKLGKTFPLLVNLFILKNIKDTQCGFKLFKRETVKSIFSKQTINDFGFDVEILFIAKKYGFKIKEIPIIWENVKESKVNSVKDPIKMFIDLLKIRYNNFKGYYEN